MTGRTLRVGICDDEESALKHIREALEQAAAELDQETELEISEFSDGLLFCEAGRRNAFDMAFLDIELPGLDGFEVARRLCACSPDTKLIFVSSHDSMVFDSQEYLPLWFVRKGKLEREMHRAVRKYFQVTARKRISHKIREGFGYREVLLRDLIYVECSGHELTFKMTGNIEYRLYGSLKQQEEELSKDGFLRVHRAYLANQEYIGEVGRRDIILKDGNRIPLGKDRRKKVRDAMLEYERRRH